MSYGHREALVDFAVGGGIGAVAHREGEAEDQRGLPQARQTPSPRLPRICIPNTFCSLLRKQGSTGTVSCTK